MWQNHYLILKQKKDFLSVLVHEMMSSEEEEKDENSQRFFVLHKPNFRSKFKKLIKIIGNAYMGKSSRRSLEQMRRREIGEPSNRSPPTLKFGSHLFLKNANE